MAKGIFITKVNPVYDDLPEARYHFPRTYLGQVQQMVNDWIIYYEPRRNDGRQVYFATARVESIEADPESGDHYYARIGGYLEFPNPVPFKVERTYFESRLRKADGSTNKGLFGRAVHLLPDDEYDAILRMGIRSDLLNLDALHADRAAEPEADYSRRTIQSIVNRPLRDAAFQEMVRVAYDATCAMTGLKLINGGGRCEIEAAHIRPVSENGPDSPRNGIALSRTCHWMFDRGVVSVADDGKILIAKRVLPDQVRRMLNPEGFIRPPQSPMFRPHAQFLRYHRDNVFKG